MAQHGQSMRTAENLVDSIFESEREVPRDEIVRKAEAEPLAPDVMVYFDHLPQGQYSKRKLVETVNREIHERGRERELGLLHG